MNSTIDVQPPGLKKATLLTTLLGSLPLGIGKKLRAKAYRKILGAIGDDVAIAPAVELLGTQTIYLGSGVKIWQRVTLNAWTAGSVIRLGDDAVLDRGIYLQSLGGEISIGKNTYVGPYVCMAGPGDVKIGDNCLIASHTALYANNHNFDDPDTPINQQSLSSKGISIGNDCWLGSGVKVMDGISIGDGCVVGAGAVVTKDLAPYSIAVGVPAKVTGTRGQDG